MCLWFLLNKGHGILRNKLQTRTNIRASHHRRLVVVVQQALIGRSDTSIRF
jgi:hypothetical protein